MANFRGWFSQKLGMEAPSHWMPDAVSVECYECGAKFTTFKRRHHCRVCGQIFCSKCCDNTIAGEIVGCKGNLRVCVFCNQFFRNALIKGENAQEAGTTASSPTDHLMGHDLEAQKHHYDDSTPLESNTLLQNPKRLEMLVSKMSREGMEFGTRIFDGKAYFRVVLGGEIVNWLLIQDATLAENQAKSLCQLMLTLELLTSPLCSTSFNPSEPYMVSKINQHRESLPSDIQSPDWLQNMDDTTTPTDVNHQHIHFKEQPALEVGPGSSQEKKGERPLQLLNPNIKLMWQSSRTRASSGTRMTDPHHSIMSVYDDYAQSLLHMEVERRNLDPVWLELIPEVVDEIVNTIALDHRIRMDAMDIRKHIKIKNVPSDVCSIRVKNGVSFTNNVTRKGMATHIKNAKILMVKGSIALQRNEERFISLDRLSLLETEYVRKITDTIMALKPDVIMVENSICKPVQDILHQNNVSVLVNVKLQVLHRILRLFDIALRSFTGTFLSGQQVVLKTCALFQVIKYQFPNGKFKHLVHLEGSPPDRGACVILHGPVDQNVIVKVLLHRLLLVQRNCKCEHALLMSQSAALEVFHPNDIPTHDTGLFSPFVNISKVDQLRLCNDDQSYTVSGVQQDNGTSEVADKIDILEVPVVKMVDVPEKPRHLPTFLSQTITAPSTKSKQMSLLADFRANIKHVTVPSKLNENKGYIEKDLNLPLTLWGAKKPLRSFPVLFSSYSSISRAAPYYCILPWIVHMQMYGPNDIPLGMFLEAFCFSDEYHCPNKVCETPMKSHVRRFCHSAGCVTMCVQDIDRQVIFTQGEANDNQQILVWKFCPQCQKVSTIRPLDHLASQYSFAMFLLCLFHNSNLIRSDGCPHLLNREQITCFSLRNSLITFQYDTIHPFELDLPTTQISVPSPTFDPTSLERDVKCLSLFGTAVYSKMFEDILALEVSSSKNNGGALLVRELRGLYDQQFGSYRELQRTINSQLEALEFRTCHEMLFKAEKFILEGVDEWHKLFPNKSLLSKLDATAAKGQDDDMSGEWQNRDSTNEHHPAFRFVYPPKTFWHYRITSGQTFAVNETEPSSLIAYTLTSADYLQYMEQASGEVVDFDLQFEDLSCRFYCCAYFAKEFHQLRDALFGSSCENYVESLKRCFPWEAKGGKSGLTFYKTRDDRFILKQMSRFEFQSFQGLAQKYFDFMNKMLESEKPTTLLAKIVGVYRLGFKNGVSGSSLKQDVLVMENLFYGHSITESYDLKGSIRNRMAETSGQKADSSLVLLDENLLKLACERPLYVSWTSKECLLRAIEFDTHFLASHGIMDYSLLVGLDSKRNTLFLGIIDYIRAFTWDKKIETLVKSSGILGGSGKTPTVISPHLYKRRFTEAMYKYFILVPDLHFKDKDAELRQAAHITL
ncbi:hypothetical protein TCAL_03156 [Tigriopus californicus]|uniref:1-phosphatidylinositol-3-phosphate 5-kinase n=1 Tax=Tigriopus californicus TaxID=6832 RepID=A0A553P2G4_TIGCA|nr:putative 1-phosphatidylinositol 3-phosphate 5-kinase isoform X2 [Tigriopus californicus]TRY71864.1 hypothetical protein TCAL_03156 [Tigriopus californicus]